MGRFSLRGAAQYALRDVDAKGVVIHSESDEYLEWTRSDLLGASFVMQLDGQRLQAFVRYETVQVAGIELDPVLEYHEGWHPRLDVVEAMFSAQVPGGKSSADVTPTGGPFAFAMADATQHPWSGPRIGGPQVNQVAKALAGSVLEDRDCWHVRWQSGIKDSYYDLLLAENKAVLAFYLAPGQPAMALELMDISSFDVGLRVASFRLDSGQMHATLEASAGGPARLILHPQTGAADSDASNAEV